MPLAPRDAEDGLAPASIPRTMAVLAYGGLPLAPHSTEATPVVAALARMSKPIMEHALHGTAWFLPAWTLTSGWVVIAAYWERRGVAERLVTAACFVLPPLLAVGLYLAFGHAVWHMLRLGAWHSPQDRQAAARWLARTAVPAGTAYAAGLAGLAIAGRDTTIMRLMPGFRVIAALSLPHLIVTTWLAGEDGPDKESTDHE